MNHKLKSTTAALLILAGPAFADMEAAQQFLDSEIGDMSALSREEQEAEMNSLKSEGNSWGAQMRSYVLHPYQMVKDLRTNHEVGNTDAVFDGDIDDFIDAGIRWRRKNETD